MIHIGRGTTHFEYYFCVKMSLMCRQYKRHSRIPQGRVHTVYQTKKRFHHSHTGSMFEVLLKYAAHCTHISGGINVHDTVRFLFKHMQCIDRKER